MVAPDGIIDQRLKKVRHTEPPYSEAYPKLINYWQEDPAYPHGNLIESNLSIELVMWFMERLNGPSFGITG